MILQFLSDFPFSFSLVNLATFQLSPSSQKLHQGKIWENRQAQAAY